MYRYLLTHKNSLIYIPLVLYWMLLFVLTSLPSDNIPSVGIGDKVEHFLAFFGLGLLLYLAFSVQEKFSLINKYPVLATILAGVLYATVDELHQMLIPGRFCEILDWTADVGGLIVGIFISYYLFRTISNYKQA